MTRSEAISLMHAVLGFRTDLASQLTTALQASQTWLESEPTKPWFLVSEDSTTTTTAEEQRVELPADFLQETDQASLYYVPDDEDEEEVELRKDDFDVLKENYKAEEDGAPEAYALLGNYFRIFPRPDDTYTLRMIYYKKDVTLSSDVENEWLKWAPFLLMGKAGRIVAAAIGDSAAMGTFGEWEAKGRLTLISQVNAREHANQRYQMGGPV